MSRFTRRRPSAALFVAFTALFVALGGPGYAATTVSKGLNADKVDGYSASTSGSPNTIPVLNSKGKLPSSVGATGKTGKTGKAGATGATGAAGAAGAAGAPGTARAYGYVSTTGVLSRAKNITTVTHPLTGVYCVQPAATAVPDLTQTAPLATFDPAGTYSIDGSADVEWDSVGRDCPAGTYEISVFSNGGANATTVTGGGGGTYLRYAHAYANGPFFFVIP